MDFLNYTSEETSALVRQLLTRHSDVSQRQLQAVRDVLDAAAHALEAPLPVEEDVQEFAARLMGAAEAEIRRVREEAQAAIDGARAELDALAADTREVRAALVQTEAETTLLRNELQTARERMEATERDLHTTLESHAAFEAQLKNLETECLGAAAARQSVEAHLTEARAAIDRLCAEAEQLRAQAARDAAEKAAVEYQLAHARESGAQRDAIATELEASTARVRALEAELADARDIREQRDALVVEFDAARARVRALEIEVGLRESAGRQLETRSSQSAQEAETLRGEVDRMVSLFDASARAVTEMAGATSATDLLTELVKRLSLQFSRVALFRLTGNRLGVDQQIGFDEIADPAKLVIPATTDSMMTRALRSGAVQSLHGEDVAVRSGMPFGGNPSSAVALPIVLQGTPVGIVYADDSDMPDSARGEAIHESSIGFARLLLGQVVVLLVRHTHELKTLAELRQYAATLLLEAKEMYRADVEAEKSPDVIRRRLKENIDCASQLYAYRAAMEGTAAAALFDEQITADLDETTPFAVDLASVVGQMAVADVTVRAEAL